MAINGKNHRQSPVVGSTSSAGSWRMARPPKMGFADLDQERRFWQDQLGEIQTQFIALKEDRAEQLRLASNRCNDGKEFYTARAAIESEYERCRKNLNEQLDEARIAKQSIALRIKQRHEREVPQLPPEEKANHFRAMLRMLSELCEKTEAVEKRLSAIEEKLNQLF